MSGWLIAALLLLAPPAQAQRPGCGYGLGLAGLANAARGLAEAPASLTAGRAQAAQAGAELSLAAEWLAGCGCPALAAQAKEAAGIAEAAGSEAAVPALRQRLDRAAFAVQLAREAAGRSGCA